MAKQKYMLRTGIILVLLAVSWIAYGSLKQISRNQRIENEVSSLATEADRIRRENETLGEKITYFTSPTFQEQEAKEKLGMKKTSEEAVAFEIPSDSDKTMTPQYEHDSAALVMNTLPNYQKWWQLFWGSSK